MSTLNTNASIPERQEFEVLQGTKNAPGGYIVDGKKLKFGRSGAFKLTDYGLAKELEARHGREGDHSLVIVPVEKRIEKGHPRTFLIRLPANYRREAA